MSTVPVASSPADSRALETLERQHAELVGGLSVRTAALLAAVRRGEGWAGARAALVAWYRTELLPHAAAEEAVLYPAARQVSVLEPLARALSHEHALLGDLVDRLASADDGTVALLHAGAAQSLLETHLAKGNDLLLPAMVAAHDTSLAQVVAEMDTMLAAHGKDGAVAGPTGEGHEEPVEASNGHTCGCHDQVAAAPELDARAIPHAIRHATIFGALGAVAPAAEMILVAPHDPLPLLDQVEQRWPDAFSIDYLERGPDAWRLRFTRTATEPAA